MTGRQTVERPWTTRAKQFDPAQVGWRIGSGHQPRSGDLWCPWDRTAGVIGPQGSGKTLDLLTPAHHGGDRRAMEQLLSDNAPLIWSVVRRFFGRADPEDLFQLGSIGFVKAVRGFDPEYGTCFSTYAVPKIAGEIPQAFSCLHCRTTQNKSLNLFFFQGSHCRSHGSSESL